MKTRSSSVLVLLAVLSTAFASPVVATPANSTPAQAYPVSAVERHGATILRPGDSATKVAAYLGSPDQRLSGDIWVYRKFESKRDPQQAADCVTLLITFRNDRVTDLHKVNEAAVQVIAAKLAKPVAANQIVAGK